MAAAALWHHAHVLQRAQVLQLSDGTEAFFRGDTDVIPVGSYPQPREIQIDGEVFLRVPARAAPLVIRTRLLTLTITGESALRVIGYAKQAGEQVEVLNGHVRAAKSYSSPYSAPDELESGEMSMVNREIDLMEKEKVDTADLQAWSQALMTAAAAR
jgi:hypothetical protein